MPLYVPKNLPAIKELRSQGIVVYDEVPEGVEPLRILLLNLMPIKAVTELDISRQLSKTDLHVQLIPMKIRGQQYKNTPQEHMDAFYRNFDELAPQQYEGMIVTGAPVERIPFESALLGTTHRDFRLVSHRNTFCRLSLLGRAGGPLSSLRCSQIRFAS